MTTKERIDTLRLIYGRDVLCTNGLFHIIDNDHSEVYINIKNNELDKRGKYRTLVVLDNIVVAKVLNNRKVSYVVLQKESLDCIYKTSGNIIYLDNDVVYDMNKGLVTFISRTGKILDRLDNVSSVQLVDTGKYLITSKNSFNDQVLSYNKHYDKLHNLTKDKNYLIYLSKDNGSVVDIISMCGGKYTYNFKTHECINKFTGEKEIIQLWATV